MRILFALPGMHRVERGAEVAFGAVARELARRGTDEVTVWGSGPAPADAPYRTRVSRAIGRERFERWPAVPPLRSAFAYEEASWVAAVARRYRPDDYDVTVTCSYPFTNWLLTRRTHRSRRPAHVFVTQNGDWPARSDSAEYRWFRCDGLLCTNPDFEAANRGRWPTALVPNGVDIDRFRPGAGDRDRFGIPAGAFVVLVVAALAPAKRVDDAVRAVAAVDGAFLVVAGDGPQRAEIEQLAATHLPGRFRRVALAPAEMPDLYRCADVLVHPCRYESFGNIHVEALATGIPVIAHDYSVTRWIFGASSDLVDLDTPGALAEAVRRRTEEPPSAAERRAWVDAAASRFAWPVVADGYGAFIRSVSGRSDYET